MWVAKKEGNGPEANGHHLLCPILTSDTGCPFKTLLNLLLQEMKIAFFDQFQVQGLEAHLLVSWISIMDRSHALGQPLHSTLIFCLSSVWGARIGGALCTREGTVSWVGVLGLVHAANGGLIP